MAEDAEALGKLSREDGYSVARLSRTSDHPPAAFWRALTDPAWLPLWLAPGEISLAQGGRARLDFADSGVAIDSAVTALTPGRILEYSWSSPGEPARPMRWEIEPEGGGARLFLIVKIPHGEDAARAFAGFEAHLDMLEAALEGVPIKFPFLQFKAAREAYQAKLAAAGLAPRAETAS
jgi:uncharacterized protein YndB with AHSA1/START domain